MAQALCTHLHALRDAHLGREGFWPHGLVTHARLNEGRRSTDASRLTFPIQMVLLIAASAVSATASVWAMNTTQRDQMGTLSTSMSVIIAKMDAQKQLEEEKARLQDERLGSMREALNDMKRRVELQQYEVQRLNETIQGMKRRP